MIYEIAEKAKKAIENDCDSYEIYIDETKSIELDSRKEELNFSKEENVELELELSKIIKSVLHLLQIWKKSLKPQNSQLKTQN